MKTTLGALGLVLVACGSAPSTPPAATPTTAASNRNTSAAEQPRVLAEDTPLQDADGNQLVGPAGWKVTQGASKLQLTTPEGDSHIVLISLAADDADKARDAAWKQYLPDAKWPLLQSVDQPDRNGWSKSRSYAYQTSPNEKRVVQAGAQQANGRWLVVLIDFAMATAEKRGGQIGKIFDRLYPKGYSRESFAGKKAHKLDAARLAVLDAFVKKALAETGVPGVSYGLVQDGAVVFAGGVGVRELGKPGAVDAKTRFLIASNTKALTTLMLAKLVDQKKLTWDGKVTDALPDFKLGSAEVTEQVQIKHLICACTGMPRQDLEWLLEWKKATPKSALQSLGTMLPTSKFGELFQYSNLMAAAGGFVGGHVAYPNLELGAAYDKAMQTLVFTPLGMSSTTFDYAKAQTGNYARPHGISLDGKPESEPMGLNYSVVPVRPAGAAWSTVEDLLKYVQMELAEGALPKGDAYIGKEALLARRTPNVAIGNDVTYGMGLMTAKKNDVTVVHHGGDLFGYHSDMMWLPEHGVGAVVLTNGDLGSVIRDQFRRKLLEVLFDGKAEADESVASNAKNMFSSLAIQRKLLTVPADKAAAAALAKKYKNEALGEINVSQSDGKTFFDFGEAKSEVATMKNPDGTVSFLTTTTGLLGLELVVGDASGKPTLTMRDGQHEYVFNAQ